MNRSPLDRRSHPSALHVLNARLAAVEAVRRPCTNSCTPRALWWTLAPSRAPHNMNYYN